MRQVVQDRLSFQDALEFLATLHRRKVSGWAAGAEGACAKALQMTRKDHAERALKALLGQSSPITPEDVKRALDSTAPSKIEEAMYRVLELADYDLLRQRKATHVGKVFQPEAPWIVDETCQWRMENPICSCELCRYRDSIGSIGAWRSAFDWVQFHAPDGTRLQNSP